LRKARVEAVQRSPLRALARAGLVLAFACIAAGAGAQALHKWVDKDGKTHYSDKPPKGYPSEIVRIDAEPPPPPVIVTPAPAAAKDAKPKDAENEKAPATDIGARRKALRESLEARLKAAQAKLDAARKALDEGEGVGDAERQVVQQRHARREATFFTKGSPPPRSNCMSRNGVDGKPIWLCPTVVPGEAYFDRRKALEEAVSKAEEELAAAELAYRRGVD
jgi:hypothetical protein